MWRVTLYNRGRYYDQMVFRTKSEALRQLSMPIPAGFSVKLQRIRDNELF